MNSLLIALRLRARFGKCSPRFDRKVLARSSAVEGNLVSVSFLTEAPGN
jgi:hypothetical protein